jgi:lipoprotein-anchoring transpeptidase ErfK/SrfK
MPLKRKKKVTSKKRSSVNLASTSKNKVYMVIRRTIMVLVPVFALLAGLGILQVSLDKAPLAEELVANAETSRSLSYFFDPNAKVGTFQGTQVSIPDSLTRTLALTKTKNPVLGDSTGGEKWIEIDLTEQKLIAHDGDQIFLESPVSTGVPGRATPTGEFKVWYKIKSTKMEGGQGKDYYYLPNVPHVLFFENSEVAGFKGYSLHGAYWHKNFGHRMSHGCVNLPLDVAAMLYDWATPVVPDGKRVVRASAENPGIRIVIHE